LNSLSPPQKPTTSTHSQKDRDPLEQADVRRLLSGRLHDPRLVLGAHPGAGGNVVVRVHLPFADSAELIEPAAAMTRVGTSALFEWRGPRDLLTMPYRVRWKAVAGAWNEQLDPYAFPPSIDQHDLDRFKAGDHCRAFEFLGAHIRRHGDVDGVRFSVWAPNAERVSVVGHFNQWDGRCHPMIVRGDTGVWELFVPELRDGELYRYEIRNRESGELRIKSDPYAAAIENRPANASFTTLESHFEWRDDDWLAARRRRQWQREPVSIYEVHLGSWRRGAHGEFLNYRDLAQQLGSYVVELGFTHVELLPITEHPLDDSWGYQCTGYFAPTRRHGDPDDLRAFVAEMHRLGIGVILDWVPGHFPKDDHALARFDGTPLYEYADVQKGEHPDWGTLVFDYGRNEVRSFLLSSAIYWLDEFHFDGLRVDAVASMLYLDYSRDPGQWTPNFHGGNENLEAIAFLRRLNELTHGVCEGSMTLAEESTAWPRVSHPTYHGGLGFSFKWNMGWMHDTLAYMSKDSIHRRFHHNLLTFGPIYAFTENFVSPLSHDEVVHGKRSLLDKMPGDEWQKFANLRLLFCFQWTFPGKKLLFMGGEFGQPGEWNHRESLPWHLADDPPRTGVKALIRDLNRLYRTSPALYRKDHDANGFSWLSWEDEQNSVLSFVRSDGDDHVVVVLNMTPVPRYDYRIGVPRSARYRTLLNSDSKFYGGTNLGNSIAVSEPVRCMGRAQSITLTLPPLGALVLGPG
jgi:1,4-alpha-glucan branching enzyme